ncbi:MAG: hypothetical protein WBK67_00800 [Minisyncoccales bacterium]
MSRKIKSAPFFQRNPLNILAVLVVSGLIFIFPVLAKQISQEAEAEAKEDNGISLEDESGSYLTFHDNTLSPFHTFSNEPEESKEHPVIVEEEYRVVEVYRTTITAYSSTVDQTNSEPFITASGSWVEDGIVATNFLPFNTKIRIPAYFGDKVFVVKDRMNRRYTDRVDIWFETRSQAKNFGIKYTEIEILEEV